MGRREHQRRALRHHVLRPPERLAPWRLAGRDSLLGQVVGRHVVPPAVRTAPAGNRWARQSPRRTRGGGAVRVAQQRQARFERRPSATLG